MNYNYLLLAVVVIIVGCMLVVSGNDYTFHYQSDADLDGTQTKYLTNHSDISAYGPINITKAIEEF